MTCFRDVYKKYRYKQNPLSEITDRGFFGTKKDDVNFFLIQVKKFMKEIYLLLARIMLLRTPSRYSCAPDEGVLTFFI